MIVENELYPDQTVTLKEIQGRDMSLKSSGMCGRGIFRKKVQQ